MEKKAVIIHSMDVVNYRPFVCNFCGKVFPVEPVLMLHYETTHDPKKPYKCKCSMQFPSAKLLERHAETHGTGGRIFKSPFSDRTFKSHEKLEAHMQEEYKSLGVHKRLIYGNEIKGKRKAISMKPIGFELSTRKKQAFYKDVKSEKGRMKEGFLEVETDEVNQDGTNIFYVEKVVKHRFKRGTNGKQLEYFIQWTGFGPEENTWEPASCCTPDLIEEYHKKHGLGEVKKSG
eukprot:m.210189 g.210189  ORF g.210189 m.210189 type:complete len:232 (+) comp15821_c0_seq3:325-1020(+)